MANALKTLFQDIATAIRNQTGEGDDVKMKPAEFPEKISGISTGTNAEILENIPIALDFSNGNQTITATDGTLVKSAIIQKPDTLTPANIAQGVNIAGIIGTLTGGGGGGGGEWLFAQGTFKPTSQTGYILEHNLGMIPDVFVVKINGNPTLTGSTYWLASFTVLSEKFFGKEAVESGISTATSLIASSSMSINSGITMGLEKMVWNDLSFFGDMTTTTAKIGGVMGNLVTSYSRGYRWMSLTKV